MLCSDFAIWTSHSFGQASSRRMPGRIGSQLAAARQHHTDNFLLLNVAELDTSSTQCIHLCD
jgi:hypothetical protein